jgi:NTE family protein
MKETLNSLFGRRREYNTGLILSGGGVRGFAHAGILKALEEAGIYPDVISGVSAGAIVGALYADGHSPDEMLELFSREKSFFKFVRLSVPRKGLFRATGLKENLRESLTAVNFEDLKIPLYIAVTNLVSGSVEYFNSGQILDKVLASAAIPVLFEPVLIDGKHYVDGGVMDNFPVRPLEGRCTRLIGISLNTIRPVANPRNLFQIAERSFHLGVSANLDTKMDRCDVVFKMDELEDYGYLDVSKGKELFEVGYSKAKEKIQSGLLSPGIRHGRAG